MIVAFDLDDTLAKEREFCLSGFRTVADLLSPVIEPAETVRVMTDALSMRQNHYSALEDLLKQKGLLEAVNMAEVVSALRNHIPVYSEKTRIKAFSWITEVLKRGGIPAIITDGRSITQRNKLKSLGLTEIIPDRNILISSEHGAEKTDPLMFRQIMELYPDDCEFVYIGDNTRKDFLWPKRLGWKTIGIRDLDDTNIHPQVLEGEGVVCPDIFY